jgi:hypothetical protein
MEVRACHCSISDLLLKEAFEDCKAGGLIRYRGIWLMPTWRNSQRQENLTGFFLFIDSSVGIRVVLEWKKS